MEYYHGTNHEYEPSEVRMDVRLFGLFLTSDLAVAQEYGHTVYVFQITEDARILDLSEGDSLLSWMCEQEILDADDQENPDLIRYICDGQLYQYDISSRTDYTSEITKAALGLGYDVVKMPDWLHSELDNMAYVVINTRIMKYIRTIT